MNDQWKEYVETVRLDALHCALDDAAQWSYWRAEHRDDQQMERSVEKELPMTYEARKPYFEAADEAGRAALDAALAAYRATREKTNG